MAELSDVQIRNAKPAATPYKLYDLNRLHLVVTPAGAKIWRLNYVHGGKNKTLGLGPYPLVGLAIARQKRDDARRLLLEGIDPASAKREQIEANVQASRRTFAVVAVEWHELNKSRWAVRHGNDVLRSLKRDAFPHIGKIPIGELTPPKIVETLRLVEDREAIETAKRLRQRISGVFGYAIAAGYVERDPSEKVDAALRPLPRKGHQPAITDLATLTKMLSDVEDEYARGITRLAVRFIALTSVRPGELRGARWEEFENLDGDKPLWRIPAERMKGDLERKAEIGGDHLVPLSHQSVAVLRVAHQLLGKRDLVFPNDRDVQRPMSENAIGYLINRAGYRGRHVPHGFRASFSTIMNEWASREGEPGDRDIIDLMLAHVPRNKVEVAYNRAGYMPRRREIAQIWADKLMKGLAPPAEIALRPSQPIALVRSRRICF
jgi:integrase